MILRGWVWKFGDDIDTDVIIPSKYLTIQEPKEFGKHCMEGVISDFHKKVKQGDIIVAGKNFGCGSSREPAVSAIKHAGISCVVAKSFARIFFRNAFNTALPLLECVDASDQIKEGNEIEIDLDTGEIRDLQRGLTYYAKPVPPFMQELIRNGGLLNHLAKRING